MYFAMHWGHMQKKHPWTFATSWESNPNQIYVKMIHIPHEILPAMLTRAFHHYAMVTTLYVWGCTLHCTLAMGLSMHTASPERGQGSIPLLSFLSLFPPTRRSLPLNTPDLCIMARSCHIEKALLLLKAWQHVYLIKQGLIVSSSWLLAQTAIIVDDSSQFLYPDNHG